MAKSGFASGFAGFLIGVVTGLGVAAGAMLVIAKSPVTFVDKVGEKKISRGCRPRRQTSRRSRS